MDNCFPNGSVISWSLAWNNIGKWHKGKCLHQDIVSHKIALLTVAFSSKQDIFTPPPVTQWSWMPLGRLSSVHRGHGTGLELEGLFIFFMCWTMLFSGCERSFLAFKNDSKEKILLTKTAFVAEPFQKFASFQMMHGSQREYSFKHWIVF